MEFTGKVEGVENFARALQAAFPESPKIQAQIINGAMGESARRSILPIAKQLAKRGDSSGALSQALKVRAQKAKRRRGKAGGMQILPFRFDTKAMAMYILYYFTRLGKNAPLFGIVGIRHGHLVEFGTKNTPAHPFLWPAAKAGTPRYRAEFAKIFKKRLEARVRREAKKRS